MISFFLQFQLLLANRTRPTIHLMEPHLTIHRGVIRITIQANLIHQDQSSTLGSKIIYVHRSQCLFLLHLIPIPDFVLITQLLVRIHTHRLILFIQIPINLIPRLILTILLPVRRSDILPVIQRTFRHLCQIHSVILTPHTPLVEYTAQPDMAIILNNTFWRSRHRSRTFPDKQS